MGTTYARAVRGQGGRMRSWLTLVGVLLLLGAMAACGPDEAAEEPMPEPPAEPAPEPPEPDAEDDPVAQGWVEPIAGDFWYAGTQVTLTEAELEIEDIGGDQSRGWLYVRGAFTNLTDDRYHGTLFPFEEMVLVVDGAQIIATSYESDLPDLPEGGRNVGTIGFSVEPDLDLAGVDLLAGPPSKQHTVLALDGSAEPEGFMPIEVDVDASVTVDDLTVTLDGGDLWPFDHARYGQLDDGVLSLRFFVALTYDGTAFSRQLDRSFELELPDGRTVTPEVEPGEVLQTNESVEGEDLSFLVADPPEGTYVLTVTGGAEGTDTIEFSIPAQS